MGYLTVGDLAKRWIYTRRGVQKLTHSAGFPPPAISSASGRVRLWHLSDIARFEDTHPEVTDADAKWRKIRKAGRRALYAHRMKGGTLPPDV